MGNLACTAGCQVDTSGCSGGKEGSIPDGYDACGVSEDDCDGTPEGCWDAADAGQCLGGPCQRTSGDRVEGQLDPQSLFHPKGNFRDADDSVYVCEPIDGHETTCVDDEGWGVCMKYGINEGEIPGGGYCWPNSGPPWWQCDKGACGQDLRDGTETHGQPNAEDGGSYCEHFPDGNQRARCEPQRCGDIQAQVCAGAGQFGLVCDLDDGCIEECEDNLDCQFDNWPQGYHCQGNRCVP